MKQTLEQRFWSKVQKAPDGCWVWTGAKTYGYGVLGIDSRNRRAHRVSFELANGPIPAGLFVCHRCDNPPCVRPDHLFLGTNRDNSQDKIAKGRQPYGSEVHTAKLRETQVVEIRLALIAGVQGATLARQYGVSESTLHYIKHGKRWPTARVKPEGTP